MFIRQLYTGCLSEAAYFIESNGEAAVIDPLRDIEAYLDLAGERKATIKYIFETHFHADFVSGHLDLAAATGATIIYGPLPAPITRFILQKMVKSSQWVRLKSRCYIRPDTPWRVVVTC